MNSCLFRFTDDLFMVQLMGSHARHTTTQRAAREFYLRLDKTASIELKRFGDFVLQRNQ